MSIQEAEFGRDGRIRSRLSSQDRKIDLLLETWGKWNRRGLTHLGFPRQAVTEKIGGRSTAPTDMPDYLVEVERAVVRLPGELRKVITTHYVYWQPVEVSAKHCKVGRNLFRRLLDKARKLIAHLLDAVN